MSIIQQYIEGQLIERDGIYFTNSEERVSYPEDGNEFCFAIEESSFWFKHRNNCITTTIKKYCPKSLFFDIGGGNGFVSQSLINEGINSVLIEPGLSGCLNAKKRNVQNIICSKFENIPFRKNSLPAIGLFDVIEHIEDDIDILEKAYNYLAQNGYIFITVPALKALWSNEDTDSGHFRRYKLIDLKKIVEKAGFKTEYYTYIFSLLPIPIFLFRSLPSKIGLNKRSADIQKHKNEHTQNSKFKSGLLNMIWKSELRQIREGKRILIGGSCFIVASKT